jgi:hypothetical protein
MNWKGQEGKWLRSILKHLPGETIATFKEEGEPLERAAILGS